MEIDIYPLLVFNKQWIMSNRNEGDPSPRITKPNSTAYTMLYKKICRYSDYAVQYILMFSIWFLVNIGYKGTIGYSCRP